MEHCIFLFAEPGNPASSECGRGSRTTTRNATKVSEWSGPRGRTYWKNSAPWFSSLEAVGEEILKSGAALDWGRSVLVPDNLKISQGNKISLKNENLLPEPLSRFLLCLWQPISPVTLGVKPLTFSATCVKQ